MGRKRTRPILVVLSFKRWGAIHIQVPHTQLKNFDERLRAKDLGTIDQWAESNKMNCDKDK